MVEKAIVAILKGTGAISAIVGTKVYPRKEVPQTKTLPYITYWRRTAVHISHLGGSAGRCDATIEIDCRSRDYEESKDLVELVRLALQGFNGTSAGVVIQGTKVDNDWDDVEEPSDGSEGIIFLAGIDVRPKYKEAIPA